MKQNSGASEEPEHILHEVASGQELREKYGLYAENRPELHLDVAKVPAQLYHLIPWAEKFGISDDLIRADVLEQTPSQELAKMKAAVDPYIGKIFEWLAGPESGGPDYSDEDIAFSSLAEAVEECD